MTVELIDHLGDDLSVVNAAKVSLHKRSTSIDTAERGILNAMMRNRHGTPWEHVVFTFRVRTSIGVAREWMRHRIGSFNEESTRYVLMRSDFYLPELKDVRKQTGKSMSYTFETMDTQNAKRVIIEMSEVYQVAYAVYSNLLARGVAKELARNVLPLGLLTEFVWTVNLRSLFNFLSLRTAPNALLEIRLEAQEVESLVRGVVPTIMTIWDDHGRQAI